MQQPHHHQHRHQQHFDYSDCDKRPGGHDTVSYDLIKKSAKIGIIDYLSVFHEKRKISGIFHEKRRIN